MRTVWLLLVLCTIGCTACEKRTSQTINIHQPGLGLPTVDVSLNFEQKW